MFLKNKIFDALQSTGVRNGDTVLVHASMRGLALELLVAGERGPDVADRASEIFHDALTSLLGDKGTVVTPAFFYEYARHGAPFNSKLSRPDKSLGAYSYHLFGKKNMHRSLCPPVSLATLGAIAEKVSMTQSAFGYGSLSPWQVLFDHGAKILFWECSPKFMTFVHHIETMVGVPHLYNKLYDTPVTGACGPFAGPVISSVRYLDEQFSIVYDLSPFLETLNHANVINRGRCGRLDFFLIDIQECSKILFDELCQNPFFLLSKMPTFIRGKIPADGSVGNPNPNLDTVHRGPAFNEIGT
jgi:aminoglycoside 3-N-acetyltransferase